MTSQRNPGRHLKGGFRALLAASVLAVAGCSAPSQQHAQAPAAAAKADITGVSLRRLRLVTTAQYLNTLAYIFGPDVRPETHFAPVQRTDDLLGVGTSLAGITSSQMEIYQKTAASVASQVVSPGGRTFLVPCKPASDSARDDACARQFLTKVGRLLYRRPLDDERLGEYVAEAGEGATRLKDFYAGLGAALEGMLVSPQVLLLSEIATPDPKAPGHQRLDSYSLASRLSFFLWNASPDEPLLKAAEKGELDTPQGLARNVDRMLASPRLEAGVRAFFDDMFHFDDFDNLAKDPAIYPTFTAATVADAREQTLRTVVEQLVVKKRDYRDLFTTRETFISPSLAALYRLPSQDAWVRYEFPADSPRVGLLTQISFLAGHSHPGRSSATLRGKALREVLLCQPVPRPPANVDFSAIENPSPNLKTARDRVSVHLKNPVCAGCHKITDPMGLALENFDGTGRFRENEKGSAIDASGSLDGKDFSDVRGLAAALHDHPSVPSCLVKRVYAYGVGSPVGADDRATLGKLDAAFAANGYRLPDLMRTIALSAPFATVTEIEVETAPAK